MKTINEIRVENINFLTRERGSVKRVAEISGKSRSLISQIKSGHSFGDKLARELEQALALEEGWFDNPRAEETTVSPLEAITVIKSYIESTNFTVEEKSLVSRFRLLNQKEKNLVLNLIQSIEENA